ncbi:acyl-CoA thioesterase [Haliangium sp.]|uniref:acyl-CoA thioesterase n=1 Tax=Haliangium sp. TaxID=2663208 RepID=UPI003D1324B4
MPPFHHLMPVRFSDIDHAGIVYYPVFFHYFHVAFEEFFRARLGGRSYVALLDEERVGFPSVSARCDYKAPLRFGDEMDIEMSVARLGERSVTFHYRVWRRPGGDDDPVLAAEGDNTCAVVDLDAFRATPIPARLRALFADLS